MTRLILVTVGNNNNKCNNGFYEGIGNVDGDVDDDVTHNDAKDYIIYI